MQFAVADCFRGLFSCILVLKVEFLELFAVQHGKTGCELLLVAIEENRIDRPMLSRLEGFNFHFAFDNDPQADGLHSACGAGSGKFPP